MIQYLLRKHLSVVHAERKIATRMAITNTIVLLLTILAYFPHVYDNGLCRVEYVLVNDWTECVELSGREAVLMNNLHLIDDCAFARLAGS